MWSDDLWQLMRLNAKILTRLPLRQRLMSFLNRNAGRALPPQRGEMPGFPDDVSVVIVAHNAAAALLDTMQSLRAAGCPDGRITVVDVASTDESAAYLAKEAPCIRYRRLDRNLGPSHGRNVGIRECSTRWVLLMDADVMVWTDTIRFLREAVETPGAAIASPIVMHADRPDLIQYADTGFHFICEAVNPYLDRPISARGSDVRDIGAASGCALLIDCTVAKRVGLFDERYFIGKEDGDFTHRIRLAGYRIVEPPAARVRHRSRARGPWLFYYQIRNRWHVILKNYQIRTIIVLSPVLVLHELLQAVVLIAKGHGITYLRALAGLCQLLPALLGDRAQVERIRVRADRDLLKDGALVVRADLAGGSFARSMRRGYELSLRAYWRAVHPLLSSGGRSMRARDKQRPRVLVLTPYYTPVLGGVETHARVFVRWLCAHGYETLVVTTRVGAASPAPRTVDGVCVHRVPPGGVRRQQAKWLALPFVLAALVRLRSRYDIVYCPDPRGVGVAAVSARYLLGKRLVLQASTPGSLSCANWDGTLARLAVDPHGKWGRAVKSVGQRIYGAADAYVCISRAIEEEARAAGIPERRMLYQPHGVRLDEFRPVEPDTVRQIRNEFGLPDDRVICLFLGRLSYEKGVLDLVEAWRRIDDDGALLVLAGPAMSGHHLDVGPEVGGFIARHELQESIRFLGGTDVPARVMQAADVFVNPSYYEGFSIAVVEAMACGLAPVISPVGGIVEYVVAGKNALLCEPGQPVQLAAMLRQTIRDPSLRLTLGREARATAERCFDSERMAARIAGLLTDVTKTLEAKAV